MGLLLLVLLLVPLGVLVGTGLLVAVVVAVVRGARRAQTPLGGGQHHG